MTLTILHVVGAWRIGNLGLTDRRSTTVAFYNAKRPHQALGHETPASFYNTGVGGGALNPDYWDGKDPAPLLEGALFEIACWGSSATILCQSSRTRTASVDSSILGHTASHKTARV
ncbi:hypothetical protein GM658_05865 [Pseudoduganella eburnea]|uniref:Integrase catalytic domain-containing protein n=1 Tax=Massilia eburnea TaxID=1776165 RepID=A0A6L6QEK4_9BURK|nr:hypothetical protein [Massilia eburnea]